MGAARRPPAPRRDRSAVAEARVLAAAASIAARRDRPAEVSIPDLAAVARMYPASVRRIVARLRGWGAWPFDFPADDARSLKRGGWRAHHQARP